ncbi:MAG: hypothetical protein HYZ28_08410 [Myxococcales bacterium]|nr:hypothetical protein [Myxococcales bacterium]
MNGNIDLSQYSEDELIDLNRKIVERLRSLRQRRCLEEMARFDIGDTVSFMPEAGRVIVGRVARTNAKTITVISTNGQRWRVSPALLSRAVEGELADGTRPSQESPHLSLVHPSKTSGRP